MNLMIRDGEDIAGFREVLSYQIVDVLVWSSLPGRAGMREVEIGFHVPGNTLMTDDLFTVV